VTETKKELMGLLVALHVGTVCESRATHRALMSWAVFVYVLVACHVVPRQQLSTDGAGSFAAITVCTVDVIL
jgi:hypothetical protein